MKPRHREGLVASYEQAQRDGNDDFTCARRAGRSGDVPPTYGGAIRSTTTRSPKWSIGRCVHDREPLLQTGSAGRSRAKYRSTYGSTRDRPIPSATQEQMVTHLPQQPTVRAPRTTEKIPAVTDTSGSPRYCARLTGKD